jgi:DNA-binding phage protein
MKKSIKLIPYEEDDDFIIKKLRKNPKDLQKFKDYLMDEYNKDKDLNGLLYSLRLIVMAERGTASKISKQSKIERTGIYKALKRNVRPRIDTVLNVLNGVGYDFNIVSLNNR